MSKENCWTCASDTPKGCVLLGVFRPVKRPEIMGWLIAMQEGGHCDEQSYPKRETPCPCPGHAEKKRGTTP